MSEIENADRKVYWIGPLLGDGGYEEEGRALVAAIRLAGFNVREINIPPPWTFDRVSQTGLKQDLIVDSDPSSIYIYHRYWPEPPLPNPGYHIWRTMFETSSLHPDWSQSAKHYNAVWVPSQFNIDTFSAGGVPEQKLKKLPCALPTWSDELVQKVKKHKDRKSPKYRFLSVMRWQERKAWDRLLNAYINEFANEPNVELIIKATPFDERDPQAPNVEMQRYVKQLSVDGIPKIRLITSKFSTTQMINLYTSADAFVLPSRGEGWGRPYIEAMLAGLSVIGPNWGANLEYMNQENSVLISGCLTGVGSRAVSEWRYFEGQQWFEPSIASIRDCMRAVYWGGGPSAQRRQETVNWLVSRYSTKNVGRQAADLLLNIPKHVPGQ